MAPVLALGLRPVSLVWLVAAVEAGREVDRMDRLELEDDFAGSVGLPVIVVVTGLGFCVG